MRATLCLFCSILLLLSGGMIYILFREEELLLYSFATDTFLGDIISSLRGAHFGIGMPLWLANSLPDGLWSCSYILLMHGLMRPLGPKSMLRWAIVIPLLGATSELMQALGLLPGVFDIIDLLFYTLPYILYFIYITQNINHHYGQRIGEIS